MALELGEQVETYRRFKALVEEITAINAELWERRLRGVRVR
jgi:hypothetical protein